jgi:hypothetical protein
MISWVGGLLLFLLSGEYPAISLGGSRTGARRVEVLCVHGVKDCARRVTMRCAHWVKDWARRGAGRQEGEGSGVAFGLWLGFVSSPSRMACPKGNHISQGGSAFGLGVGLG